jgi:hypothetical protein
MVALNPLTFVSAHWLFRYVAESLFWRALFDFFFCRVCSIRTASGTEVVSGFYALMALAVLTKRPLLVWFCSVLIIATSVFLIYLGKIKEVLQEMQVVRGAVIFLITDSLVCFSNIT